MFIIITKKPPKTTTNQFNNNIQNNVGDKNSSRIRTEIKITTIIHEKDKNNKIK